MSVNPVLKDDQGAAYPEDVQRLARRAGMVVARVTPNTGAWLVAEINDLELQLRRMGWYE